MGKHTSSDGREDLIKAYARYRGKEYNEAGADFDALIAILIANVLKGQGVNLKGLVEVGVVKESAPSTYRLPSGTEGEIESRYHIKTSVSKMLKNTMKGLDVTFDSVYLSMNETYLVYWFDTNKLNIIERIKRGREAFPYLKTAVVLSGLPDEIRIELPSDVLYIPSILDIS